MDPAEILDRNIPSLEHKLALVHDGREYSYGELFREATLLSAGLRAGATQPAAFMLGLRAGFVVAAVIALVSSAIGFTTLRKHEHTAMAELVGG